MNEAQRDEREDGLLVAFGSFAEMDQLGDTLTRRWEDVVSATAAEAGCSVDVAKRMLVGLGSGPTATELADVEMCDAIVDGACVRLTAYRPGPALFNPDSIAHAVVVMDAADWTPHWRAVQALCILHGISSDAAHSALVQIDASEEPEMAELSFRASVVATASLFIHHSGTLH